MWHSVALVEPTFRRNVGSTIYTRRHIPKYGTLHSQRRENLKSYTAPQKYKKFTDFIFQLLRRAELLGKQYFLRIDDIQCKKLRLRDSAAFFPWRGTRLQST
jgi:hypothetical protein